MRKALIVGIDHYDRITGLSGCVNDARAVKAVLERHADGTTNFTTPEVRLGVSGDSSVTKQDLKEAVRQLFNDDAEIALLYFAGHGYTEDTGGYLCASDCETGDDGLALSEVMTLAHRSPAKNKVIVLDSCHSGIAGDSPVHEKYAEVAEGMTILSASGANQYALEVPEAAPASSPAFSSTRSTAPLPTSSATSRRAASMHISTSLWDHGRNDPCSKPM